MKNVTINGDIKATTMMRIIVKPNAAQYFSFVIYFGRMKYMRP
jgi:hypothetical protein